MNNIVTRRRRDSSVDVKSVAVCRCVYPLLYLTIYLSVTLQCLKVSRTLYASPAGHCCCCCCSYTCSVFQHAIKVMLYRIKTSFFQPIKSLCRNVIRRL